MAAGDISISALVANESTLALGAGSTCRVSQVKLMHGIELIGWSGRFAAPLELPLRDDCDRINFSFNCHLEGRAACDFPQHGDARFDICEGAGNISYGRGRTGRYWQEGALDNVTVMVSPLAFDAWTEGADAGLRAGLASDFCFLEGHRGAELQTLAQQLHRAILSPEGTSIAMRHPLWLQGQAMAFVGLFLEARRGREADRLPASMTRRLNQVRDRMLGDLSTPPQLDVLARDAGMSAPTLARGFRRLFGTSVYGLFQQERMHAARCRLMTDGETVAQVAAEFGYTNASHFASAFSKQFGVTPGAFKRRR